MGPGFLGRLERLTKEVEVGPARSTVITYINPAVAILLGVVLLGEPFTVGIAIGFPLILLGSWMATSTPAPETSELAAEPPAS